MSDGNLQTLPEEELIVIPSFLTSTYSTRAACSTYMNTCGSYQCTGGCQAEMDECGTKEWCSAACLIYVMCTTCQAEQYDPPCGICELGQGCNEGCRESCNESCSEGGCDDCMDCLGEGCGACLCSGGQGQYPCSQSCSECGRCEDCMDCENSCQNSIQSQINPWDWFFDDATTAAYHAITEQGLVSNFSSDVWNDLVDRVRDVRKLMDVSPRWDEEYANYYDTRMSSVDKTLTATRFNSLLQNINQLHPVSNVVQQTRGQEVRGRYFTALTTALNAYIDSL